jgi:hypothetical protein
LPAIALLISPSEAAKNAPINSQVGLAYAGDTGMYASWNTFTLLKNPPVKYGLSPSSMNLIKCIEYFRYLADVIDI